jgi:hypothetical protein
VFSTGLPNIGAIMGAPATLTCEADGYPTPHFIIKKGEVVQTNGAQASFQFPTVLITDEIIEFSCTPYNMMGQGPEIKKHIAVLGKPFNACIAIQ